VIVDTTVQPKNVTFPTDAKLLNGAREKLVQLAQRHGWMTVMARSDIRPNADVGSDVRVPYLERDSIAFRLWRCGYKRRRRHRATTARCVLYGIKGCCRTRLR